MAGYGMMIPVNAMRMPKNRGRTSAANVGFGAYAADTSAVGLTHGLTNELSHASVQELVERHLQVYGANDTSGQVETRRRIPAHPVHKRANE